MPSGQLTIGLQQQVAEHCRYVAPTEQPPLFVEDFQQGIVSIPFWFDLPSVRKGLPSVGLH